MSTMVIFLLVRGQVSRGRANIVSWRPTSQKPIYDYGYYSGTLVEYRILVVELTDQRCRSSVCVCVCDRNGTGCISFRHGLGDTLLRTVTVGAPISRFSPSRWQGPSFLASGRGSKGQSPRLIGLRARLRFLGRGQPAPSPLATGLGSAVSSPSGGRGGAPATKMFSYILEVPRGPFRNLLGAKFGGGGHGPLAPP